MRKRMSGRVWAGLALVGVGFVCAATGQAAEPPPCATGTYQSDEPPLLPAGGARIAMRDGTIHLQGCSPAAVTLRAKKKGVRVKAAWDAEQCPGIGKVRLKARADNTCTTMRGVVKAKRYRKRFVAGAVSPVPPPTVDLDSGIVPAVTQVAGFDGNPPRPVAALTDQSGILLHFVENELIVVSDNTAAVGTFAASIGGSVVRSFMPTDFGLPGPAQHLVRFDPASADGSALAADLQAIDPTASGALRVSSAAGLGTLATAAAGATGGVIVAPNVVMTPHAYFDRRTTENGSLPVCPGPPRTNGPNCVPDGIPNPAGAPEAFNQDAYQWSYMRQGGTQNIAVGEAWRALWLSQRLTAGSVKLAFIDGGFSDSNDHPDGWEHHTNSIHADGLSENDLECTGGLSCPWHGTNAVSAAMAVPDDMIGAAGPAGPIAKPVTIRMSGDVFNYLGAWGIAFTSGARILNMSFGARVPAAVSFVLVPLEVATEAARDGGMLLLASAGNDGQDVDAEDCAPPFDWPCWEEAWWAPCENAGVTCIGALAGNATTLMSTVDNNGQVVPVSNWGGENVELFGPGILWVGEDPNDPEPHRFTATSAAAPFVAGVAALVMAANPNLDANAVEATLLESAHPSPDGRVGRYVNAFGAVIRALGGGPICRLPNIGYLTPPHESLPCFDNTFTVSVQPGILEPVTYVWRHWVDGAPVELADDGRISGSRTPVMTIADFGADDYGTYDVVVSNPCGSTTSGLTAVTPPVGVIEPGPFLPDRRAHAAMAFDRGRGRMVLHGGWYETLTPENFLDRLNVNGETWERDDQGIWQLVTTQGPSPRYGHAVAYDEARGVTVLFGGHLCPDTLCVPGGPGGTPVGYNDTWEWDGTAWTERIAASAPSPRSHHAMAYDSVRQRVVMFGGRDPAVGGTAVEANVWEWDGATWTARVTSPDPVIAKRPVGRWDHGLAFDRARNILVLHGGVYFLPGTAGPGETWELSGAGEWRLSAVPPDLTEDQLYHGLGHPWHAMTHDYDRGATLLTTLTSESGVLVGRLWEWMGTGWIPRSTLPWRTNHAIAYDDVRMRTAIVGGESGYISRADVWEWRYVDEPGPPVCAPSP